jgi:hypothetical protein
MVNGLGVTGPAFVIEGHRVENFWWRVRGSGLRVKGLGFRGI